MGYSISVKFSDSQERKQMETFLLQNKELLEKLKPTESLFSPLANVFESIKGEDLPYSPENESFLLGFHGSEIPRYVWNLCAWMSVKSTYRDEKLGMFFYYDDEKMLVTFDQNNTKNTVVDQDGIRIQKKPNLSTDLLALFNIGVNFKKQKEIFTQLNNNWNEYKLSLISSLPKSKNSI